LAGVLVLGIVTPVLGHSRHAGVERALDRAKKVKQIAKDARQTAQQALALAQQAGSRARAVARRSSPARNQVW
jgi:phage gp46-like protein